MNTDYNLYKIFLYLYEEKSISKTASKLYVSQPAISYSLKELENQLGYTLFYRNSKGIEPTAEAKELYGYISTAFNILNEAEDHLKKLDNLKIGCLKVGISPQIGISYITDVITKFRKKHPGVKFEITSKESSEMIEMLENRNLDLMIDTLPINSKKNINKEVLAKKESCFIYNKKSFENIKINTLEELLKYNLILPSYNTSVRSKLDEAMESRGIKINSSIEIDSSEMLLEMVNKGLGIGYIYKDFISNYINNSDLEIIELDAELPTQDICLVYMNDFLTTASKKFINMLDKEKE